MSPISSPEPCPHLKQVDTFYFCKIYDSRPDRCVKHDYPSHICPVGLEKLKLNDSEKIRIRLDTGYALTIFKNDNTVKALDKLYNGGCYDSKS